MRKRRASFSGDIDSVDKSTAAAHKDGRFRREKKRLSATVGGIRVISGSTLGLLRRIRAVVAKALRFSSMSKKSSRKVTSSSAAKAAVGSRSFGGTAGVDSQRAEAIDDCVEFLNSSTNSVSSPLAGK